MEWFRLPTDEELYLSDKIYPQIEKLDFDEQNHAVILEWRKDTPSEVKERAKNYDNLIIKAK